MRFASVGPDGFARLWGVPEAGGGGLRLLALQQLALPCAAVAVDPAGEVVVCGAAHAPRVYVLRATDLTLRSKRSLAAQAEAEAEAAERGEAGRTAGRVRGGATALRFSPSGACLAVGAGDGRLYLLDPAQRYAPLGVLAMPGGIPAHRGGVTALDWACDGAHLRSGCDAGVHALWDAAARQPWHAAAAEAAGFGASEGMGWASASVPVAWGAEGVWPARAAAAHVRSLARSPEGDVLACGDAAGGLALFRAPARATGAGHRRYRGSCAPVEAVAFSWDDRFVLTVARDGCALLWRHWNEAGERELDEVDSDAEEERAMRARHTHQVRDDGGGASSGADAPPSFSLAATAARGGAKRGARLRVLPAWRRTVQELEQASLEHAASSASGGAPSGHHAGKAPGKAPDERAELAWVHGYRGHDCLNNVAWSKRGEAVYPAAAVVVLLRLAKHERAAARRGGAARSLGEKEGRRRQRFFRAHTDDVLCLAAHPTADLFVSGQKAFAVRGQACPAYALVWDATDLEAPPTRLGGVHEHAVTAVAFSPDGSRVLTAGLDAGHSVALWEWARRREPHKPGEVARRHAKGTLLLRAASSPREVLGVAFLLPRLAANSTPAGAGAAGGEARVAGGAGGARSGSSCAASASCASARWRAACRSDGAR